MYRHLELYFNNKKKITVTQRNTDIFVLDLITILTTKKISF